MEINCHVPITIRIVGVPTDDQLTAIGRSLTRLVAARLAEAQRLVAHRHGGASGGPSTVGTGLSLAIGTTGANAGAQFLLANSPDSTDPDPSLADPGRSEPGLSEGSLAQPLTVDLTPLKKEAERQAEREAAQTVDTARVRHDRTDGRSASSRANGDGIGGRDDWRLRALRNGQRPMESIDRPLDLSGTEHTQSDVETYLGLRPTKPGDANQQQHALPRIDPNIWFRFTNLHPEFERVARRAAENPNPKRNYSYWLARFRDEFEGSMAYILEYRPTRAYVEKGVRHGIDVRGLILRDLRLAEDAAIKENQQLGPYGSEAAVVTKVEGLRQAALERWNKAIDDAAARFMVLARNQAEFEAVRQVGVTGFKIAGLPADVEPTVPATIRPDLFQQDPNSPGFAQSMIKIMEAIQAEYHHKVIAINYGGHSDANPSFGGPGNAGLYSVDIDISSWAPINADGFYDHAGAVEYFMAVEAATKKGDFAWLAFYNDFEVAQEVNRRIGKFRVNFSGAGGPPNPTPDRKNSYHHGPAPYILHIHMNFMPSSLALQYVANKGRDDLQYFDFSGGNQ